MLAQTSMLWKTYSRSKGTKDREKLIERYAPLAKYVVDRLHVALPPSISYEDLIAQAVLGLIEAVDNYDQGRGVKFETFAYHRIRGSVMDMLRDMDWMPRSLRRKERELSSVYASLEMKLGREPNDAELAEALQVSPEELIQLYSSLSIQGTQSLNEIVCSSQGEAVEAMDMVADEEGLSPEAHVEKSAEKELLVGAINQLPEKEQTVIALYYQENLTLKEIAAVLGVSESRVCQLHSRALSRLRENLAP
jgi:RNA polymerase sigma factor for flagellar operon FliA